MPSNKIAPASRRGELAGSVTSLISAQRSRCGLPRGHQLAGGTGGCMLGDNGNSGSYRRLICLERICSKRGSQWGKLLRCSQISVDQCPFERRLVIAFSDAPLMWCPGNAVNPDFLPDVGQEYAAARSFGSCRTEKWSYRCGFDQSVTDMVVFHGRSLHAEPWLDPKTPFNARV